MAYSHVAVRYFARRDCIDNLSTRIEAAKTAGWQWWLDTIPVIHGVYELGMEVRKAYPFVKFYATTVSKMCRWDYAGSISVAAEVFIAVDTCPYVLATIGYGGYHQTKGEHRYMVNARGIENGKYQQDREQHSMRLTTSLKSATKNTLANLLPYTTHEVAKREYHDYYNKSVRTGSSKASQLPALLSALTHSVILNEIRALKAMGVVFTTPEFCRAAENCDAAAKVANEERNKRVDAVLIHFVEHSEGVVAECAGVHNVRGQFPFKLDLSETYPLADVPQAYQDKVAVLQTLAPGDHVDGVGMKVEEMLYWIEK